MLSSSLNPKTRKTEHIEHTELTDNKTMELKLIAFNSFTLFRRGKKIQLK